MDLRDRIKAFSSHLGLSIREFEKECGLKRGNISNMTGALGSDKLSKIIVKYPDLNIRWLLLDEGKMISAASAESLPATVTHHRPATRSPERSIPIYDMPIGGSLSAFLGGTHNALDYISLPGLPKCDGATRMWGNKMDPEIKAGDFIIYKKVEDLRKGLRFGRIYLVAFELQGQEYIAVQYIDATDDDQYVSLVGGNPGKHPPEVVPRAAIKALAEIKASVRYTGDWVV